MQVLVDCAQRYDTMHFLTLTYDDRNCPLYVRRCDTDKKREDFKYKYQFEKYMRSVAGERPLPRMEEALRKQYNFLNVHTSTSNDSVQDLEYKGVKYHVSASLHRRDVQNVLKMFRIYMERDFKRTKDEKYKLNFKYYGIGEYGPQTSRPHYHFLFFGLTPFQADYLSKMWKYGNADLKEVQRSSKDFANASRYVANYINKAYFEPNCVQMHICERRRVMCSTGMVQLSQREIDYYTGKDLVPSTHEAYYDPADIERIYNRLKRTIGTSQYKLSDKYRKKLFYEKITEIDFWTGEKKVRTIATPLQNAITTFVQLRLREDAYRELEDVSAQITDDESRARVVAQYWRNKYAGEEDRERTAKRRLQHIVSKSKF